MISGLISAIIIQMAENDPLTIQAPIQNTPRRPWRRVVAVLLGGFFLIFIIWKTFNPTIDATGRPKGLFGSLASVFQKTLAQDLIGESDDRVNFLLLGIGGPGHDGPNLTDTILLASLQPSTGQVAVLSIPRDLGVDLPGLGYRKINEAYAYGVLNKETEGGLNVTRQAVENITGLVIPYVTVVDFQGFKQFVDMIGGVDVNVAKSFVDTAYPTENFAVKTIAFTAGLQHLDGEKALEYARSRHGCCGEGSDFARSKRQKIILEALDKNDKVQDFMSPRKILNLYDLFKQFVATTLTLPELARLPKLLDKVKTEKISLWQLDDGPDGLLQNAIVGDGFFLQPLNNSWDNVKRRARLMLDTVPPKPLEQKLKVGVYNATKKEGWAQTVAVIFDRDIFSVQVITNYKERRADSWLEIYNEKDGPELNKISSKLKIKTITGDPATHPELDASLILGEDSLASPNFK